jgi:ribosome-associated translation inhibitor RaiA
MHGSNTAAIPIEIQVTGPHGPDIAEYAEEKIRAALRYAHAPVLHARVRISRHGDPAVERPVTVQANLDVDGKLVRAHVHAQDDREGVDLLEDRLRQRLQHYLRRTTGHWEDRRGRGAPRPAGPRGGQTHEWRHGDEPIHRPPFFPRPPEERQIIRHKSYTLAECGIDEAVFDLETMDYDFHLFTELGSGQDSVLYRAGPTGYRLAQVEPHPEALARHAVSVTVSEQPAPVLTSDEAIQRMADMDYPFLFYVDGERGRGALLYHRYDGHYGLVTPADADR